PEFAGTLLIGSLGVDQRIEHGLRASGEFVDPPLLLPSVQVRQSHDGGHEHKSRRPDEDRSQCRPRGGFGSFIHRRSPFLAGASVFHTTSKKKSPPPTEEDGSVIEATSRDASTSCRPCHPFRPCHRPAASPAPLSLRASRRSSLRWSVAGSPPMRRFAARCAPPWSDR